MATLIPCSVDTAPMAAEIKTVSNHVKGTTAAVVTMQSAVIAAETNGANKVCSNVNRGFFTLMQSQISQKIANKQSRVEALLMHLNQQKRQLSSIKATMEREYGRIAERYLRIFTSINKELETRIRQIDQPVFEIVNKHMVTSSNRMHALSSWATTSQAEGLTQGQQILVSNMKHNAQVALECSTDFLAQLNEQRILTNKILISNPMGNEDRICHIPVVIVETLNDETGITRTDVRSPEPLAKVFADYINDSVRSSNELQWSDKETSPMVAEEFARMVESAAANKRVKDLIKKMYLSSDFATL